MPAAYPTADDVAALLLECEIPEAKVASQNLAGAVQVAIIGFERETGYRVFLASLNDEEFELVFDAPETSTLELQTGFVSISKVEIMHPSGIDTLSAGTDFETKPFNAARWHEPITSIKIRRRLARCDRVRVTGLLGYSTEISDRVFTAIVQRAALHVAPQLVGALASTSGSAGGEVKARETGDTRIEFTSASDAKTTKLATESASWSAFYDSVVNDVRLRVYGF